MNITPPLPDPDRWGGIETPAFVLDLRIVAEKAHLYGRIREEAGVRVLYSLKPLTDRDLLFFLKESLDGFTASSLFSAILARSVLGPRTTPPRQVLSITTPGYRPDEVAALGSLCDRVVLNSRTQWEAFGAELAKRTEVGLRIRVPLSYLDDARYNPARPYSQLGVPLAALTELPEHIIGLHLHGNCNSPVLDPLEETVACLRERAGSLLHQVRWLNLGGGYRLPHPDEWTPLYRALAGLRTDCPHLEILLEPGASLVREAGTIVASVLDLFESDGRMTAVLDTTVNHMPEVFEYQYAPDIAGHSPENRYLYQLVGCTCLAGDVFGEYRFAQPLRVGDRIVFLNSGAYTLAKAHWFNGIPLPIRYTIDPYGQWKCIARPTLADYRAQLGWESL